MKLWNSFLSLPSLCVHLHRSRHIPIQKVRDEEQASSATPARLPGFSRLHLHRLLLSPFLLSLLQRVWFSFPSLQVPFLLLWALTHLLQPGDPFGRGGGGPKYRENAPQAQAEPQLATWALWKPSKGVGLRLGAAAAGSVRQQRVHGLTPKPTIRGRLSEKGRKTSLGQNEAGHGARFSQESPVAPPWCPALPPPLVQSKQEGDSDREGQKQQLVTEGWLTTNVKSGEKQKDKLNCVRWSSDLDRLTPAGAPGVSQRRGRGGGRGRERRVARHRTPHPHLQSQTFQSLVFIF